MVIGEEDKKRIYSIPRTNEVLSRDGYGARYVKDIKLNDACQVCGKREVLPYKCSYCGGVFCSDHHMPHQHSCNMGVREVIITDKMILELEAKNAEPVEEVIAMPVEAAEKGWALRDGRWQRRPTESEENIKTVEVYKHPGTMDKTQPDLRPVKDDQKKDEGVCSYCGQETIVRRCDHCGKEFCYSHIGPGEHECFTRRPTENDMAPFSSEKEEKGFIAWVKRFFRSEKR